MKDFLKSFIYAINGLRISFREHRNLIIQFFIGIIAVGAGFYFGITASEWCILLLTIAIVIGFEMMNTAIENLVNLVTKERNPLAGKIKDIAAGAVLFVSLVAVIIGVLIFKKYIL
jgi:diacylglycerol kinase